jgi:hypothetical protein
MAQVVPFICRECGAQFHELTGFICSVCSRLLCRDHLARATPVALCTACARKPAS